MKMVLNYRKGFLRVWLVASVCWVSFAFIDRGGIDRVSYAYQYHFTYALLADAYSQQALERTGVCEVASRIHNPFSLPEINRNRVEHLRQYLSLIHI